MARRISDVLREGAKQLTETILTQRQLQQRQEQLALAAEQAERNLALREEQAEREREIFELRKETETAKTQRARAEAERANRVFDFDEAARRTKGTIEDMEETIKALRLQQVRANAAAGRTPDEIFGKVTGGSIEQKKKRIDDRAFTNLVRGNIQDEPESRQLFVKHGTNIPALQQRLAVLSDPTAMGQLRQDAENAPDFFGAELAAREAEINELSGWLNTLLGFRTEVAAPGFTETPAYRDALDAELAQESRIREGFAGLRRGFAAPTENALESTFLDFSLTETEQRSQFDLVGDFRIALDTIRTGGSAEEDPDVRAAQQRLRTLIRRGRTPREIVDISKAINRYTRRIYNLETDDPKILDFLTTLTSDRLGDSRTTEGR